MRERNLTYHAQDDRADRLLYILLNVGLGDKILQERVTYNSKGGTVEQLTDTGVLVIRTIDKKEIITMMMPTVAQLKRIYGGKDAPRLVFELVAIRNKKHYNATKDMKR